VKTATPSRQALACIGVCRIRLLCSRSTIWCCVACLHLRHGARNPTWPSSYCSAVANVSLSNSVTVSIGQHCHLGVRIAQVQRSGCDRPCGPVGWAQEKHSTGSSQTQVSNRAQALCCGFARHGADQ